MQEIHKSVQRLAIVRQEIEQARKAYNDQIYALECTPEMTDLSNKIEALKTELETLDLSIRTAAVHAINQTGQTGHPAVKTRTVTEVVIEEIQALAWANLNMPIAVIHNVDKKMLTDYAKKHAVDWATVWQKTQITIAKDLSPYLDQTDSAQVSSPPE